MENYDNCLQSFTGGGKRAVELMERISQMFEKEKLTIPEGMFILKSLYDATSRLADIEIDGESMDALTQFKTLAILAVERIYDIQNPDVKDFEIKKDAMQEIYNDLAKEVNSMNEKQRENLASIDH